MNYAFDFCELLSIERLKGYTLVKA